MRKSSAAHKAATRKQAADRRTPEPPPMQAAKAPPAARRPVRWPPAPPPMQPIVWRPPGPPAAAPLRGLTDYEVESLRLARERLDWENAGRVAELAVQLRGQRRPPVDASAFLPEAAALLEAAMIEQKMVLPGDTQRAVKEAGEAMLLTAENIVLDWTLGQVVRKISGKQKTDLTASVIDQLQRKDRVPRVLCFDEDPKTRYDVRLRHPETGRAIGTYHVLTERRFRDRVKDWCAGRMKEEEEVVAEYPNDENGKPIQIVPLEKRVSDTMAKARAGELPVADWFFIVTGGRKNRAAPPPRIPNE